MSARAERQDSALRAEDLWSSSRTTQDRTEYCDPYFGCSQAAVTNTAQRAEANIGLIIRFLITRFK
jgi:hypothetical protein